MSATSFSLVGVFISRLLRAVAGSRRLGVGSAASVGTTGDPLAAAIAYQADRLWQCDAAQLSPRELQPLAAELLEMATAYACTLQEPEPHRTDPAAVAASWG